MRNDAHATPRPATDPYVLAHRWYAPVGALRVRVGLNVSESYDVYIGVRDAIGCLAGL